MVVGLALMVTPLARTAFVGQRWWWEPEVVVPWDGGAHRVALEDPGSVSAIWSDRSLGDPECTHV